jgi:predicted RNA methylase
VNLSLFDFSEETPTATPTLNLELVTSVAAINAAAETAAAQAKNHVARLRAAAATFADMIANLTPITWDRGAAVMTDHFEGTDAEGAWSAQDLYNAAEAGLAKVILTADLTDDNALQALADMNAFMPSRRRRSDDTTLYQQFSTPAAFGWLAARAAQLRPDDIVLEPSAGSGMLAAFAARAGAQLIVNEIDTDRLALLDQLKPHAATSHDARYLSALYRGDKPSVVIMNPPFSIDHNLGADRRVRALALSHVDQAARTMRRGGRLIAIVGHSQAPAAHLDQWDEILTRMTVRASIAIDGNAYKHMGTTFGTALVVLDATVDSTPPQLYGTPMPLEDALAIVDALPRRSDEMAERATHLGGQTRAVTELRTQRHIVAPFAFNEEPEEIPYVVRATVDDPLDQESRFATYRPQSIEIVGARSHPTPLVESTALACVKPPMPKAKPKLPPSLIRNGVLSETQLEAVIYAADSFSRTIEIVIEDEEHGRRSSFVRRGWTSGYGTGVGKGRTVAAIIASTFADGQRKAVWVSESQDLFYDALRDWKAITGNESALFSISDFPVDVEIEREHGIAFVTYATLRSRSKRTENTRVNQLIRWLGPDFNGVLNFDEAHNLANAIPSKSATLASMQQGSLQGQAALELQNALPGACVLYTSATSASKIDALGYAPRLGLWGVGTAFPNRDEFLTKVGNGGTAAFELLCRDMKALGVYLSASLSYDGVAYERLHHRLDEGQVEQYNALAAAWRLIHENIHEALATSNAGPLQRAATLSQFESSRMRSLQALAVAQCVPTFIADAERRLAEGKSVVVQLTNTNEAIQERALAKLGDGGDLDDINLSNSEMMLDFIERGFPVMQFKTVATADGVKTEAMKDSEGNVVLNPEAMAMREELKTRLATMMVPMGPLDLIIDHFGTDAVAEITGRGRRIVRKNVDGVMQRVIEERNGHANLAEQQAFRDGRKRILIFSEAAGGTGFSYHADRDALNQEQRVHYLLQTGFRSDRALQGMGRTHRTNQAHPPIYVLVVPDIPGFARFISVIARRLEDLGALTRGQRDAAGGGLFSAADNLEGHWGQTAVDTLLRTIATGHLKDVSHATWYAQTGLNLNKDDGNKRAEQISVSRFLNRVLACDLDVDGGGLQGRIMDALLETLESIVEEAKAKGTYDLGIQTIKALSIKKTSEHVAYTHEDTGAKTNIVELTATVPRETTTYGQIHARLESARDRYSATSAFFFKNEAYGLAACYPIATTRQEGNRLIPRAKVVTPLQKAFEIDQSATSAFVREIIDDKDAKDEWKTLIDTADETVEQVITMITGTLLPIYDRLPDAQPIVYRVVLDTGERIIGRVITEEHRAGTFARLGLETKFDPGRAYRTLKGGHPVTLANGWQIKRSRLSGNERLEIIVPAHLAFRVKDELLSQGILSETVAYRQRYFIPSGPSEEAIFLTMLDRYTLAAA